MMHVPVLRDANGPCVTLTCVTLCWPFLPYLSLQPLSSSLCENLQLGSLWHSPSTCQLMQKFFAMQCCTSCGCVGKIGCVGGPAAGSVRGCVAAAWLPSGVRPNWCCNRSSRTPGQ